MAGEYASFNSTSSAVKVAKVPYNPMLHLHINLSHSLSLSVLARPLVRMVSAYGKILKGGGTPYLGSLCMTLEMVQKCCFGLIVGVGPLLSLPTILNYIG